MYEHVQMLASLYRRAHQLPAVRGAFAAHYQRVLARDTLSPPQSLALSEALQHLHSARGEPALIAAVAAAEDALQ
jgi:hypothetical protein